MKSKFLVLPLILLGLFGCGQKDDSPLVVATTPGFPPFTFRIDGKVVGFEIDLAEEIAKELGRPLEIRETDFSSIIEDVAAGKANMSISTISITKERAKLVNFSRPYYKTGAVIISQEEQPLTGPENAKGKLLGVQTGTLSAQICEEVLGAKCRYYESSQDFPVGICDGEIDGAIEDAPIARELTRIESGLAVTSPFLTDEQYGVAVQKNDLALLKAVNKVIQKQEKEGMLQRNLDKWFRISDESKDSGKLSE